MSKNIIVYLVRDLNSLINGLEGFSSLIPYGTDHDDFNSAIRLFLQKVRSDLEICRDNIFEVERCGDFHALGARDEPTMRENLRDVEA